MQEKRKKDVQEAAASPENEPNEPNELPKKKPAAQTKKPAAAAEPKNKKTPAKPSAKAKGSGAKKAQDWQQRRQKGAKEASHYKWKESWTLQGSNA